TESRFSGTISSSATVTPKVSSRNMITSSMPVESTMPLSRKESSMPRTETSSLKRMFSTMYCRICSAGATMESVVLIVLRPTCDHGFISADCRTRGKDILHELAVPQLHREDADEGHRVARAHGAPGLDLADQQARARGVEVAGAAQGRFRQGLLHTGQARCAEQAQVGAAIRLLGPMQHRPRQAATHRLLEKV